MTVNLLLFILLTYSLFTIYAYYRTPVGFVRQIWRITALLLWSGWLSYLAFTLLEAAPQSSIITSDGVLHDPHFFWLAASCVLFILGLLTSLFLLLRLLVQLAWLLYRRSLPTSRINRSTK